MSDIFADTSGFFALLAARDPMHAQADRVLRRAGKRGRRFVTSDYVLDETATLLGARGLGHLVPRLFAIVHGSAACRVAWMDPDRFGHSRALFEQHLGERWSFTDCSSFVLMRELDLTDVLTTNGHFRAAGFRPLLV